MGEELITNIVHRWADLERLKSGEMIAPHFVTLHPSYGCNESCRGCSYNGELNGKYMSEQHCFAVVDKFLSMGVRAFDFAGGGDPCFVPYLPQLLRHIRSAGAWSAFLTNGTMMNEEVIDAMVDCCTYVRISLEASCPEDYAEYKRVLPKLWDVALANIEKLRAAKKIKDSAVNLSVKFGVGKTLRGIGHYHNGIEMGLAMNAERITFRAFRHEPEELSLEEKIEENESLEKVIDRYPSSVRNRISYWIVPVSYTDVPQCWLNACQGFVDWDGGMYICCYMYYRAEEHYLGNIITQPFDDIWYSKKHREVIAHIDRKKCALVDCKFFPHHRAYEDGAKRGFIHWL